MIEIVAATRVSAGEFGTRTALGLSLRRPSHDTRLVPHVAFSNRLGLPEISLTFIHDDVWIEDIFFADSILEGLKAFDVIGVAGNRRRAAHQTAWAFIDDKFSWDDRRYLSGRVMHGKNPFGTPAWREMHAEYRNKWQD